MSLIDNAIFQREKRLLGNACGGEMWRCQQQGEGVPPRSPNGAACPSPKPRRASRRRLAASAGCARRPPLRAGERGETSGGGAGATGWVGASGGKGRSRAAGPPEPPQPRWLPGLRPGRALRRGPVACRLPTELARRGGGRLRARPGKACARRAAWGGWADPRRGHQRAQGGRGWADAGGWDCVKSGFIFPIPPLYSPDYKPIEFLWRKTKKQATYNKYFKEFAAVVVSADKALAYFAAHPEMVLELLGLYCKESAFELKQVA